MDFLEQLLQALFIIFLNFYLYLFVTAGCVSCGEVVQRFRVHPSLKTGTSIGLKASTYFLVTTVVLFLVAALIF